MSQKTERRSTGLNKEFLKEGIQIANKYFLKCLTSFVIQEIQSKTNLRFCLTHQNGSSRL